MDTQPPRRVRAGDDDRTRTASILSDALHAGKLTVTEFDERTRATWEATYRDELIGLVDDLNETNPLLTTPAVYSSEGHSSPTTTPAFVTPPVSPTHRVGGTVVNTNLPGGNALSFGMFGGTTLESSWSIAPNHVSIAVMGGNELDLRNVVFPAHEISIICFTMMGGIEITVPDDVRVDCTGVGLMGGFGVEDDKHGHVLPLNDIPANAPIVHIKGVSFMGGVDVVRRSRNA